MNNPTGPSLSDMAMERPMPELTEEDKKLLGASGVLPLQIMGGGSKDKFGANLGGRTAYRKQLDKDLDLEAYLEGIATKGKGSSAKGEITGGGVRVTKRFKKGGKVKTSSASKRADGCAVKGKTRGKMI